MRVLHFISDTNIGGAGRLLCNQLRNMDTSEFESIVALPDKSKLVKELRALPCKLILTKSEGDVSFSKNGYFESREIIKKLNPDIVHSHASLSSRLAAANLHVPVKIFTKHCAFEPSAVYQNPLLRFSFGAFNQVLSSCALASAGCACDDLIKMGYPRDKIKIILNGSEPIRILSRAERAIILSSFGLNKNNFVISIFARLEEYKGHATFLRAAQLCKRYYPNFRFFIVGDGSRMDELKALSCELGLDDVVCFTGFCEDVAPIFNITDINVNCSYKSETSSLSLSEGMSLGIPSVVSDCGGNTYMVKNGENGLTFPMQNEEALAMAIIRLYCDKELYKNCSANAYGRYCTEFTAKAMTNKLMLLYKSEYENYQKKRQRV